jgi:hypothetical protein
VEGVHWSLQDPDELEKRRDSASDVTVINGTQNHYHYRFLGDFKVAIRWLSCPCVSCLNKCWDQCCNKAWVGEFELQEMTELDQRGYGQHKAKRKKMANQIANELSEGDTVAMFTQLDAKEHKYWLGKVVSAQGSKELTPVLQEDCERPISGELFSAGERVCYVEYYDRLAGARNKLSFELKQSLGVFMVPVLMLRKVVTLYDLREMNQKELRNASSREIKHWGITTEQHESIEHAIEHVYKDQDE